MCDSYLKCHYGEEKHLVLERNRDRLCWALIALFFPNRRTAFDSTFIVMYKIDSLTFSLRALCMLKLYRIKGCVLLLRRTRAVWVLLRTLTL